MLLESRTRSAVKDISNLANLGLFIGVNQISTFREIVFALLKVALGFWGPNNRALVILSSIVLIGVQGTLSSRCTADEETIKVRHVQKTT